MTLVTFALVACGGSSGNDPILTSSGGNSSATGPTLTIADISIAEGNTGTKTAEVTVSLSSALDGVSVKYATSDGTANAGSDYTTTSGTLNFTASSTMQTITVSITGDTSIEADETFTITLSEPTKATLGTSAAATVTITNDDEPTLTISNVSVAEGNTGTSTAEVTVSLSSYTNPASVKYATSDGTASAGSDYTTTNGTLNFTGGSTTQKITVSIAGDTVVEENETFTITLSNPSTNATLGTSATATVTITNDDTYPINDTGLVFGGNDPSGNNSGCTSNITAPQDCHHGRDVTHNDPSDGPAGFSYTKLDNSGNSLAASATSWACVKDNVTGLVWEVKTDDNGIHDKDNQYKWGGVGADNYGGGRSTDWDTLVNSSKTQSLCGFADWRVPHIKELASLVNLNRSIPSIDKLYFPYTQSEAYWSSSAGAREVGLAWQVSFRSGTVQLGFKGFSQNVRLVRGGK